MMKKRRVSKVLAIILAIVIMGAFTAGCKKSSQTWEGTTVATTTSDTAATTGTTPEGTTTTDTTQPTVTEAATPGATAAATVTAAATATTAATATKAATATQKATPTTKATQPTATSKATGQVKSMKFKSIADCYVIKRKPTENYPDEPTMNLFTGDFHRELFYKFDVKGVPGKVVGAKLMLYCTENNGVPTKDAGVWGIPTNWEETTITFEKKPAGTLITNFTVPKDINVWITNDVSSYVKGNGQYAFNLISNESVRITLTAREYDKADLQPYLEVMYQ